MNNSLEVIELTSVDDNIIELANLLKEVVNKGASVGFLAPINTDTAIEYWSKVLKHGVILYVAKINNEIRGAVQLHLAMQQNGTHRAEVSKLMVDPSSRRCGIASTLMKTIESRATNEGRSLIILDTRLGDQSNILYKSLGYVESGTIPSYAQSSDGKLHGTVFYYKLLGQKQTT
ncbi:N-acetyltransferase family protein [Bacillus sp. SCS-151]|uniref:GNAT family N-acetyltransferase n=1 Tax=Nanhaiella sioensis TaxID=3115293 RepID=UPI0039792B7B